MTAPARAWRTLWCWLLCGGHELYVARAAGRLYQQCVRCGYQSRGWELGGGGEER